MDLIFAIDFYITKIKLCCLQKCDADNELDDETTRTQITHMMKNMMMIIMVFGSLNRVMIMIIITYHVSLVIRARM